MEVLLFSQCLATVGVSPLTSRAETVVGVLMALSGNTIIPQSHEFHLAAASQHLGSHITATSAASIKLSHKFSNSFLLRALSSSP